MKATPEQQSLSSYDAAINGPAHFPVSDNDEISGLPNQSNYRKTIAGLLLVLTLAFSRAGVAQFGRNLYSDGNFTASSLVTWATRSSLMLLYPIASTIMMIFGFSYRETCREGCKIFSKAKFSMKALLIKTFPLATLSIAVTFLNYYALSLTSATNVTAVTSTSAAFVYILSLIWLKEPFFVIRMLAVGTSVVGVVLIAYSEGFGSFGSVGILLAAANAILSSFFRVFVKRVIGQASVIQSCFFLSIVSFEVFLVYWIPAAILISTKVEIVNVFPWTPFLLSVISIFVYGFCLIAGIAVTYPIYISMGPLLAIPINALIDIYIENLLFDFIKIIGTIAVVLGFLILTIPIPIIASFSSKVRSKISRCFY